MQTLLYSLLHFLVDGLCALSIFARHLEGGRTVSVLLFYNFCAFALQLPLGTLLDFLISGREEAKPAGDGRSGDSTARIFAGAGCGLTLIGALLSGDIPASVLLGLGNALFHVGGGVATIRSDRRRKHRGRELGIFVAPGALGLFLGSALGKSGLQGIYWPVLLGIAALYLFLFVCIGSGAGRKSDGPVTARRLGEALAGGRSRSVSSSAGTGDAEGSRGALFLSLFFCFSVVILRSFLGFSVSFSWKTGFHMGLLCTLAVVLGKMLGGLLAAKLTPVPVMIGSLLLSVIFYLTGDFAVFGLLALLFFNMTMPVTLQFAVDRLPGLPGFAFGLLTLALFLGFVPALLNAVLPWEGRVIGAAGSALSLLILLGAFRLAGKERT